jgi:hypothetical protein
MDVTKNTLLVFLAATLGLAAGCQDHKTTCYSHDDCGACQKCENGICQTDATQLNPCGDCAETPLEVCFDGVDNDCDGATDEEGCDDPCTGVACQDPPPDECLDAINCRRHTVPGTCQQGACSYTFKDFLCPDGCEGDCAESGCVICEEGYRPCSLGCCSWEVDIVDADGDVGRSPSVVVDQAGVLHVGYIYGNGEAVRYARFDGAWDIQTVHSGGPRWVQIDLAPDGSPRLLYFDYPLAEVQTAVHTGEGWQISGLQAPDTYAAGYSIALDAAGVVHISFVDDDLGLIYSSHPGSVWLPISVDATTAHEPGEWQSALLLDEARDRVLIAYFHSVEQILKLATREGDAWSLEEVDTETRAGMVPLMALDGEGNPHILYNAWKARKYAWREGDTWQVEEIFGTELTKSRFVLDSQDRTHLVMPWSDKLEFGLKASAEWEFMTADSGLSLSVPACALTAGGSDMPHLFYYDAFNMDLKHATLVVAEPERP